MYVFYVQAATIAAALQEIPRLLLHLVHNILVIVVMYVHILQYIVFRIGHNLRSAPAPLQLHPSRLSVPLTLLLSFAYQLPASQQHDVLACRGTRLHSQQLLRLAAAAAPRCAKLSRRVTIDHSACLGDDKLV